MRLVLDTNVVAAGFLWQGPPNQLIQWAFDGAFNKKGSTKKGSGWIFQIISNVNLYGCLWLTP